MKIIIKNLGPIHEFEFDLDKDLHLIYGKNSVGKSYAMTTVYVVLKELLGMNAGGASSYSLSILQADIKDGLEINKQLEKVLSIHWARTFIPELEKSLLNCFSFLRNGIAKKQTELHITLKNIKLVIELQDDDTFRLTKLNLLKNHEIALNNSAEPQKDESQSDITYYNLNINTYDLSSKVNTAIIYDIVQDDIINIKSLILQAYYIPSGRLGYYNALINFGPIIADISQYRNQIQDSDFQIPKLPKTVSDYILDLTTFKPIDNHGIYSDFAKKIEDDILKGKVLVSPDNNKLLFYDTKADVQLELTETSSMIAELAPIVAYLRYILKRNGSGLRKAENFEGGRKIYLAFENKEVILPAQNYNLLFIEEPEAHLHPEIILKLTEKFAELINHEVKIIITSHSNYMFNELGNLILEGKVKPEQLDVSLMEMTPKGSIQNRKKMKVDEWGIDDDNFSDTIEKLYNERSNLYNKKNKEIDARKDKKTQNPKPLPKKRVQRTQG